MAFAGSNSSTSVNYKLVKFTSSLIDTHKIELVNMANHTFPMYSEDREKQLGFPEALEELKKKITNAQGLIISVNEHNSGPSAYFKNILDWFSRMDRNYMENTKVLLMSASPGKRGAIGAQEYVRSVLPRAGAEVVATFSLPSFYDNFDEQKGILDSNLANELQDSVDKLVAEI